MTGPELLIGPTPALSRGRSFLMVTGVYLIALGVAIAVGALIGIERPLVTVLVADLAATAVVFVSSRLLNNSSMYDAYWSVAPPVIVVFFLAVADPSASGLRQALCVVLVWAWAIRLTANWARGWPGLHHEDWRYVIARQNGKPYWLQSFLGFHLFPTIQVFLGCLALYPAVAVGTGVFGPLDVLAVVLAGGAVILELVADEQLRAFNRTKQPGDLCTVGLWGWCRHPNYLGELSFWWGLWLFGLAADASWWWTVIGPLGMTAMFLFASIPLLDRRGVERRPGYAEHMTRVPALLPRPPRTHTHETGH